MKNTDAHDDRISQLRDKMFDGSRPAHNRRSTDRPGMTILGGKNVYATNVIYQFGPSARRLDAPRGFDGVNWKMAPRHARWWAMNSTGQAHWFCVPSVDAYQGEWFAEAVGAPDFGFQGDWRESLTDRPPERGRDG